MLAVGACCLGPFWWQNQIWAPRGTQNPAAEGPYLPTQPCACSIQEAPVAGHTLNLPHPSIYERAHRYLCFPAAGEEAAWAGGTARRRMTERAMMPGWPRANRSSSSCSCRKVPACAAVWLFRLLIAKITDCQKNDQAVHACVRACSICHQGRNF